MTATTKTNIPASVETMFTDPQPWKRLKSGMYLYYNNTTQIGITLATKSPRYNSLALNKGDAERLIAAKRDGKIKEAYVVAAKLNPGEPPTYLGAELAEVVVARLERRPTIDGKIHGPFWVLEEGEIDDEDDEF
jgi:hypothetical protein